MTRSQSLVSICVLAFALLAAIASGQDGVEDNDWTACNPVKTCSKDEFQPIDDLDEYYATAAGLSGDDLRKELNSIIRDHRRYSYGCVWSALADLDRDGNNPGFVIDWFTNKSIPLLRRDCGFNDGDSWNREHVWAKSQGFPKEEQHAYTDVHHLRAADRSINGDRSNYDYKTGGIANTECTECGVDVSGKTWEPADFRKGQLARVMLYMDVRYEGDDESDTPDLVLVDESVSGNKDPTSGYLSDLLGWHCAHPVSDEERARNDGVHSWQGNRNPFIDNPAYVESVFNYRCSETSANIDTKDGPPVEVVEFEVKSPGLLRSQITKLRTFISNMIKRLKNLIRRMMRRTTEL